MSEQITRRAIVRASAEIGKGMNTEQALDELAQLSQELGMYDHAESKRSCK